MGLIHIYVLCSLWQLSANKSIKGEFFSSKLTQSKISKPDLTCKEVHWSAIVAPTNELTSCFNVGLNPPSSTCEAEDGFVLRINLGHFWLICFPSNSSEKIDPE